jgi:interferon gamma-inducible protein 30
MSIILIYLSQLALNKNPPSVVDVYMESMCPYCRDFAVRGIKKFLATEGHEELAEFNFIPYGNAKEQLVDNKYVFTCQHGEAECEGNLIETCIIHLFNKPEANDLIVCLEDNAYDGWDSALTTCIDDQDKIDAIRNCQNSDEGNILQHQMAARTDALNPPHKYVPWVVIDGKHNDDITVIDVILFLCDIREDRDEFPICNNPVKKKFEAEIFGFLEMIGPQFCYKHD